MNSPASIGNDQEFNLALGDGMARFQPGDGNSYLVALAAVQRGLRVTFWGSNTLARSESWGHPHVSKKARLFTVTDGRARYFFDNTLGEKTPLIANQLSANKAETKRVLKAAGIVAPEGITVRKGDVARARQFLQRSDARAFIFKPVKGSMGRKVSLDQSADQILDLVRESDVASAIVEEHIFGREFRAYVVGDEVVVVYERIGAFVIGNGRDSVAQLVLNHNARRKKNPHFRNRMIDLAKVSQHLATSGKTARFVPVFGQKVMIGGGKTSGEGGQFVNAERALSDEAVRASVGACKAVGLCNGGVDLIVDGDKPYILETNSRASIRIHCFPEDGNWTGNRIAEAIIDHYFPTKEPVNRDRTIWIDSEAVARAFARDGERTQYEVTPWRGD